MIRYMRVIWKIVFNLILIREWWIKVTSTIDRAIPSIIGNTENFPANANIEISAPSLAIMSKASKKIPFFDRFIAALFSMCFFISLL
jgi:hypothetical protein